MNNRMATNMNLDAATCELLESIAISIVSRRFGYDVGDDVAEIFAQCRAITAPQNFRAAVEDGLFETMNLVEDMEEKGRNSVTYRLVRDAWVDGAMNGRD